jgi:uracil-DNA glycosylase
MSAYDNILQEWRDTIFPVEFIKVLEEMSELQNLAPTKDKILASMEHFPPLATKVVIIGQDPYPTEGQACGLAFSIPHNWTTTGIPASLRAIIECLKNTDILSNEVERGDLTNWAKQGVLLLNAALTTTVGHRREHAAKWKKPVEMLITNLAKLCSDHHTLTFMLWGGDAIKSFEKIATKYGHIVMKRAHPSPLSDNRLPLEERFAKSTQFADTAHIINWGFNTNVVSQPRERGGAVIAFCDGGCSGNGKPDARASYGIFFTAVGLKIEPISGEVAKREYLINESGSIVPNDTDTAPEIRPSNNRGEMLALCLCFDKLVTTLSTNIHSILIVSDSKIYINLMNGGYDKHVSKGTQSGLKNLDLVEIGATILAKLRKQHSVEITHVNSHLPKPPPTATSRERLLWKGNDRADRLCNVILYGSETAKTVPKKKKAPKTK